MRTFQSIEPVAVESIDDALSAFPRMRVFEVAGSDPILARTSFRLPDGFESLSLFGGRSNMVGAGNDLDNVIVGSGHRDRLEGAGGNDTLDGGLGKDTLAGGEGNDVFVFSTEPASKNVDRIADFNAADDLICLAQDVFGMAMGPVDPGLIFVGPSSVADSGNAHIIFNTLTGELFYNASGIPVFTPSVHFATIDLIGLAGSLTAANFVVT